MLTNQYTYVNGKWHAVKESEAYTGTPSNHVTLCGKKSNYSSELALVDKEDILDKDPHAVFCSECENLNK